MKKKFFTKNENKFGNVIKTPYICIKKKKERYGNKNGLAQRAF